MAYLDNNGVTYLWNKIKGLFNKGITNLSVSGKTITFTKGDGTTGTITTQDTNTTYSNFKGATASADGGSGLVPAPTKGNEGKYLKADGTWGTPANTTYADMKGATSSAAGTHGLVPAPAAGKQSQYLRGDGTWATPTNTTYSDATQSTHGLMSVDDKKKLDGIASGANNYVHPTSSGNKHIPSGGSAGQFLKWSADGTAVWANDNNTTYSVFKGATASADGGSGLVPAPIKGQEDALLLGNGNWATISSKVTGANGKNLSMTLTERDGTQHPIAYWFIGEVNEGESGLMIADDKVKLDGIADGANKYVHPTTSGNKHIPSGGSAGQFLKWSADGTAVWANDNNTTYSDATQSTHGLMSVNDKKKLDAYPAYSTIQSTYATKSEITNMYKYCGSVASSDKLPTTGQRVGDVYNIEAASKYGGAGMNVAWNGTAWDPLGEIFTITAITNAQIDAICV
ncbi:hypothetical protein DW068_11710 [Anaerobutyricum hallii]|jgi:hypothetical protein|uniref:Tail fiber protein n=1 Tax=Anaerobutyricum hallii TaxID=39488 RepID=A0A415G5C7_9FIRM|nr:hypothetical protein [Anaerobutyricum hallii]RHK37099.1 hypothetical protein DW068_11710 [Anaerobutyricum hallii]DAQ01122.1 MAG TPA: hypothetical protein [Caudoviricetes sp.]